MIKPTIGRVVLVHRFKDGEKVSTQPEPALVCYVHSDAMINVGGFDANGQPFSFTSCTLLQDNDVAPKFTTGAYAEWMPYQKMLAQNAGSPPA